ncbi:MAG: polyprenol monophosphomannose synthase [Candidatus Pacearchaeota archaeon]
MKNLVIIPTYNEKENIREIVKAIISSSNELSILVVDDNSPDKTSEIVGELIKEYPKRVYLIKRAGKLGLGTAYIEGFKWAIIHKYDLIIQMDADFSHNPNYVKKLVSEAKKYDLVLGSRYVSGGGTKNWGIIRRYISKGGNIYASLLLNLPVKDATGGFKCFRRSVLESIDLDSVKSNGYCFQIETTYRSHLKGFKIKEIPIIFEDRRVGKSKMSKKIVFEALIKVPAMRSLKKGAK